MLQELRAHRNEIGTVAEFSFIEVAESVAREAKDGTWLRHGSVLKVYGLPGLTEFVEVAMSDADGFDPRDANGETYQVTQTISFLSVKKVIG
jgi:hypothetical protein